MNSLQRRLVWTEGHEYRRGDFVLEVLVWEHWYVNDLGQPRVPVRQAERLGLGPSLGGNPGGKDA